MVPDDRKDALPMSALLALAMTGFICIMTETLPAGLLPGISVGLGVSPAMAGQLVTAYAIGSLTAAIPLTLMTATWPRRRVLLTTILGFLFFNSLTALSTHVVLTLIARFGAGAAAGLAWSLLAGYARRMVPPAKQGRAMAVAMVGTPIALSIGVPLGTWLGQVMGWRLAFGAMSLLTLVLIAWVLSAVPDYPGQVKGQRTPILQVATMPGIRAILGVVFTWMLAHNIFYTYIAPLVAQAGLADRVDVMLLVFGGAALVGIWLTGRLVDHLLRRTVLMSLASFALAALVMGLGASFEMALYLGVLVWGLTFGGAATLLQTALADAAGDHADAALSLNVVTWNSAIAGGGILGGLLLNTWGPAAFHWAVVGLLLISLSLASASRRHGFPNGSRVVMTAATEP